jgi:uncharacterized membrane protein YeaQ/YmgE (transglycosylase-associated protein family)
MGPSSCAAWPGRAAADWSDALFLQLFGTVVIAGIVGYVSEKSGFTRNGYLPSIIICVGGAFLFYFIRIMFGIRFGAPGIDAILSSVGALIIVPTHWRKRR